MIAPLLDVAVDRTGPDALHAPLRILYTATGHLRYRKDSNSAGERILALDWASERIREAARLLLDVADALDAAAVLEEQALRDRPRVVSP